MPDVDREELALSGVVRQRGLLADGRLKARELVALYLERIERINPRLNAIVKIRRDEGLEEADAAQHALDGGDSRPLLGIPFVVKDDHDLAGQATSYGTGAVEGIADEDADTVRILRGAGAIPIGKTTMPELGMHPFTESVTWGVTRNPWDVSRTPGGSSGGSAAAVAAGLASFATGGDGGGSIRIPASCCNLFGLKVQRGRVTRGTQVGTTGGLSEEGVLTREVADAALIYDVLIEGSTGTADAPPELPGTLQDAASSRPAELRIGLTFKLGAPARVDQEVRSIVTSLGDALRSLGHEVIPATVEPGLWGPPFAVLGMRLFVEQATVVDDVRLLEPRTRATLRICSLVNEAALRWATRRQRDIEDVMTRVFDDFDLLLTPTLTLPPVPAGRWQDRGLLRTSAGVLRWCPFTSLSNFTGHPAANLPAGFTAAGLPVGAQLLAPAGGEATLIGLAAQVEHHLRWNDRRPAVR
jgi:amidase